MKQSKFMFFLALTIGLIFTFSDVSALFAQESSADEFTLEEITVTAQKREENQQKVPITMETISGDTIKELGKSDIDQILSNVSSVIVNKAADGMRVSLRGMSNDNNVFFGVQVSTPTVAVNMDGAYTNRNAAGTNLYDVERVEVLYGPQSTMYSTSSPGGIVNVITSNPKLEQFEGSASLEGGDYSLKNGQVALNIPVTSKIALRASGSYSKRNGYLTNGADDEDIKSGRLKALFQATDKLSFVLIGEITKQGGQGPGNVVIFDYQDEVDNPWTAAAGQGEQVAGPKPNNDQVNKKYSGRMDWDMGFGTLAVIPAYTPRDNDFIEEGEDRSGAPTIKYNHRTGNEKSVEARMTSATDFTLFKWIAGASWYKSLDRGASETYLLSDLVNKESWGDMYQEQESKAVFANLTYPVTDRLRTSAGMRYTKEINYSSNFESGRNNNEPEVVDMSYDSPDYKVGIEYDLAENSMLYSDFSTSYRLNGMGTSDDGEPFPPEKLKAITVGAKNRFFGNKMQINASAYYYRYKNYYAVTGCGSVMDNYNEADPSTPLTSSQISEYGNGKLDYIDSNANGRWDEGETVLDAQPVAGAGGDAAQGLSMDNKAKTTGHAKVYGVDIQTSTIVTQNLKVDLSVSYLKKYFTELYFDWAQITNDLGIEDLDYSGKDMTFAPHYTFNASLSYNIPMGNGGTLTPRFDTRYQTSYKMYFLDAIINVTNNPGEGVRVVRSDVTKSSVQEAYHVSDFMMVYAHPTGNWTITGYVKNLENYAVKRSIFSARDGVGELTIGPPRTYGGILTVRF